MSSIKINRPYHERFKKDPEHLEPTWEDIKCEVQLQALQNWEILTFKPDLQKFKDEIKLWEDEWAPYLQREGQPNNRYGLLLTGLEGDEPRSGSSLPEAWERHGDKNILDIDFKHPTELYDSLESIKPLLDYFSPLGRTYLLRMGPGSFFPPHKDDIHISRKTFRIAGFLGGADAKNFIWTIDGQRVNITNGDIAYINTQKTHATAVWNSEWSYHLIMSIPKTWENVQKLLSICENSNG